MTKSTPIASALDQLSQTKQLSHVAAEHFLSDPATEDRGYKILHCADRVKVCVSEEHGVQLKTFYCKQRECRTCQYRRAERHCSQLHRMFDQFPELSNGKWLFLTVTVRNTFAEEIGATVRSMTRAFVKLTRRGFWHKNVLGGIRYTEVIPDKSDDEMAHPHFHCLLLVTPSMYEGKNYISTDRWIQEWQQALKVNYSPFVRCKRLSGNEDDVRKRVIRPARYSMKPQPVPESRAWFHQAAVEMQRLPRFKSFGLVKDMLAKAKGTSGFVEDDEQSAMDEPGPILTWDPSNRHYTRD